LVVPGFRSFFVVIAAGASALAAQHLPASSHGPLPGHTGGFGEPTCRACHFDYDLNEGAVMLRLDSLPGAYAPEQSYRLHLVVRHPELERGGFQIAARFEDGAAAGQFEIPDTAFLRVQSLKGIDYLSHTGAGADLVKGDSAVWTFSWKAPASDRPVVFHVATNVSNRDASEFGDRIFTGVFHSGGERVKK
jgi:hypothetical protein